MRRKVLAVTLAVVIAATASVSASSAKADRTAEPEDAAATQVQAASKARQGEKVERESKMSSGVVAPPQDRADPTAPTSGLLAAIADIETLSRTSENRPVLQALDSVRSAYERWGGDRPDVPVVVQGIGDAARSLRDAGLRDPQRELRDLLAGIARHIAVNINTVVGAGPEGEAGRRSIGHGDELKASGDPEGAIDAYLDASQDFGILAFDPVQFRVNIENILKDKVNAASSGIAVDGEVQDALTFGFGDARREIDGPKKTFLPTEEMNIASVSKNVTATAVMKLLQDHSDLAVELDSVVKPFLPPDWSVGSIMDTITFRDLLTHRSGLAKHENPGDAWDGLKKVVASYDPREDCFNGQFNEPCYKYQNINFALFRVIIPWMWEEGRALFEAAYASQKDEDGRAEVTVSRYERYIKQEVLSPLGLVAPQCGPRPDVTALAYSWPWDGNPGQQSSGKSRCGAGGWHFTAKDLVEFIAKRQFSEVVLNSDTLKEMKTSSAGYMGPADNYAFGEGAFGTYHAHRGDRPFDFKTKSDGFGGVPIAAPEFHSCIMEFPNGVHASLLLNSDTSEDVPNQCTVLKQAYEGAWSIL